MRNARNHFVSALGLALALGVTGVAHAASTQHIEAGIDPSKLPKKKFTKGVALTVRVFTTGPSGVGPAPNLPAQTATSDIDFDKNIKFTTKGLKRCDPNDPAIQSGTTQQAIEACPESIIGSGNAQVRCIPPLPDVPAVVTAFAATPPDSARIILHSRADALDNTTPLVGELQDSPKPGFGDRLHVPVPQLAAGICTLTDFTTTVEKTIKGKGAKKKKKHLVSARCKSKNKPLQISSDWTYYDGAPPATNVTTTVPCKPKK